MLMPTAKPSETKNGSALGFVLSPVVVEGNELAATGRTEVTLGRLCPRSGRGVRSDIATGSNDGGGRVARESGALSSSNTARTASCMEIEVKFSRE